MKKITTLIFTLLIAYNSYCQNIDDRNLIKLDSTIEFAIISDSVGYLKKIKVLHFILDYYNAPPYSPPLADWYIDYLTRTKIRKEELLPVLTTHFIK